MNTNPDTRNAETTHPQPASRARKRFMMPAVVLGLLGGHFVFILVAITLGTGDPSFAVVPDYYDKAVAHDDRKGALAASAELGWRYEIRPGRTLDAVNQRDIIIALHDRDGGPIEGATVTLSCYHFARAGEVLDIELSEVLPGRYAGRAGLGREGFWQFDLAATRGDERFVAAAKQFVYRAEAAR